MNAIDPTVGWIAFALAVLVLILGCVWAARQGGMQVDRLLTGDDATDALARDFGPAEDDIVSCEDCEVVLTDLNVALTCGAHFLCSDCDGDRNPCRDCASARFHAGGWVR